MNDEADAGSDKGLVCLREYRIKITVISGKPKQYNFLYVIIGSLLIQKKMIHMMLVLYI